MLIEQSDKQTDRQIGKRKRFEELLLRCYLDETLLLRDEYVGAWLGVRRKRALMGRQSRNRMNEVFITWC